MTGPGSTTHEQELPSGPRLGLAGLLIAAAAAHLPALTEHLRTVPWMGWLFVAFILAALAAAATILMRDTPLPVRVAGCLAAAALLAYAATRLVSFPQLGDDVGTWGEPWGVVASALEVGALVCALLQIRARRAALSER